MWELSRQNHTYANPVLNVVTAIQLFLLVLGTSYAQIVPVQF